MGVTRWGGPLSGLRLTGDARRRVVAAVGERYRAGASIRVIAADIGRSYGSVRQLLHEGGVQPRPRRTAAPRRSGAPARAVGGRRTEVGRDELTRRVAQLYLAGASIRDVADATDRSYGLVHALLEEAGVERRRRGGATRGERGRPAPRP